MLNPAGGGFIVPEYTIAERRGRSEIMANYGSAGRLRLVVEIVDLADCASRTGGAANTRLVRLEPTAARGDTAQCRRVSYEVEPGAGIDEALLRSKLFIVWLTATNRLGTAGGNISIPVERRIDLSKPE